LTEIFLLLLSKDSVLLLDNIKVIELCCLVLWRINNRCWLWRFTLFFLRDVGDEEFQHFALLAGMTKSLHDLVISAYQHHVIILVLVADLEIVRGAIAKELSEEDKEAGETFRWVESCLADVSGIGNLDALFGVHLC